MTKENKTEIKTKTLPENEYVQDLLIQLMDIIIINRGKYKLEVTHGETLTIGEFTFDENIENRTYYLDEINLMSLLLTLDKDSCYSHIEVIRGDKSLIINLELINSHRHHSLLGNRIDELAHDKDLLIYGAKDSGKTTLLNTILSTKRKIYPKAKVIKLTNKDFKENFLTVKKFFIESNYAHFIVVCDNVTDNKKYIDLKKHIENSFELVGKEFDYIITIFGTSYTRFSNTLGNTKIHCYRVAKTRRIVYTQKLPFGAYTNFILITDSVLNYPFSRSKLFDYIHIPKQKTSMGRQDVIEEIIAIENELESLTERLKQLRKLL